MEKRNVLFVMSSLRNGGAERSLVNLLQLLDYDRYNVDLLLFQNEGMFLKQVPKAVNIISNCNKLYTLYDNNKAEALKHPYLSAIHMIGTFISRKKKLCCEKSPIQVGAFLQKNCTRTHKRIRCSNRLYATRTNIFPCR